MNDEKVKIQDVKISYLAMLAAVLFHGQDLMKAKLKMNDSGEEVEAEIPVVQIEKEPDGNELVCLIPMKALMHYTQVSYNMQFRVLQAKEDLTGEHATAAIAFKRADNAPHLYGANGQKFQSGIPLLDKLMARIQ